LIYLRKSEGEEQKTSDEIWVKMKKIRIEVQNNEKRWNQSTSKKEKAVFGLFGHVANFDGFSGDSLLFGTLVVV